jgi:hypothetical protein
VVPIDPDPSTQTFRLVIAAVYLTKKWPIFLVRNQRPKCGEEKTAVGVAQKIWYQTVPNWARDTGGWRQKSGLVERKIVD